MVTAMLHLMHISMQFSDTMGAKEEDVNRLFARAQGKGVAWITGTEAGRGMSADLRELLSETGRKRGYRVLLARSADSWIAVSRNLIKGGWDKWWDQVLTSQDGAGTHGPRGVLGCEFDAEIGHITVMTAHYLTQGRPGTAYNPNLDENRKIAQAIGRRAVKHGKGRALVFYGGDQNIDDRKDDTFLGAPLTSLWDELKKYENTGHGVIDVIASYDHDGRVSGKYIRALDDREFPMHSDHHLVEGGYEVRLR